MLESLQVTKVIFDDGAVPFTAMSLITRVAASSRPSSCPKPRWTEC